MPTSRNSWQPAASTGITHLFLSETTTVCLVHFMPLLTVCEFSRTSSNAFQAYHNSSPRQLHLDPPCARRRRQHRGRSTCTYGGTQATAMPLLVCHARALTALDIFADSRAHTHTTERGRSACDEAATDAARTTHVQADHALCLGQNSRQSPESARPEQRVGSLRAVPLPAPRGDEQLVQVPLGDEVTRAAWRGGNLCQTTTSGGVVYSLVSHFDLICSFLLPPVVVHTRRDKRLPPSPASVQQQAL